MHEVELVTSLGAVEASDSESDSNESDDEELGATPDRKDSGFGVGLMSGTSPVVSPTARSKHAQQQQHTGSDEDRGAVTGAADVSSAKS